MKPTAQLSSQQQDRKSFPLTDYNFQTTIERSRAGIQQARSPQTLRSIWKMSAHFFGFEARLDYAIEFALFSLILAVSAWPIFWSAVAVVRMMRNY
jgi:hypothetical protein